MCFSATSSFTAAVALAGVGYLAANKAKGSKLGFLALVPTFFAIQQFAEGALWLQLGAGAPGSLAAQVSRNTFLFFAFCFWPAWIPFAFWFAEEEEPRRKWLFGLLVVGALLTLYNIWILMHVSVIPLVVQNSIQYPNTPDWQGPLYLAIVALPAFFSSLSKALFFGVAVVATYAFSYYAYYETMTSVWCFFAAVVSLGIYLIIHEARR